MVSVLNGSRCIISEGMTDSKRAIERSSTIVSTLQPACPLQEWLLSVEEGALKSAGEISHQRERRTHSKRRGD